MKARLSTSFRGSLIVVTMAMLMTTSIGVASAQDLKAAMLLPGSINDQSWNAIGHSGLMKIKELGFEVAYSENVPAADHVTAMRDYARQGYKIVIGHSGRFLSAEQRVAPEFPNVQFITAAGSSGFDPNVMSIDYNNVHFGCQLGALAALMSKTGKIGRVDGLEGLPTTIRQTGSFRICAKKVRPDIEVGVIYLGNMEDAAAAKEAAFSLVAGGADVLSGQLNAAQSGLIQAAKEKGVFVTGRSFGHTAIAPEQMLTNVMEKWPEMYMAAAMDVKAGKLAGVYKVYGYDTPHSTGAELKYSDDKAFNPKVPADVVAKLKALQDDFKSGALTFTPTKEDARPGK
jgi:basic membrane protein A and related proteins